MQAILILVFTLFSFPAYAADPELIERVASLEKELVSQIEQQQVSLNHIWTMVAAALVAFMQGGFLLLEAGMVRSKNSINVAQKNITDFIFSIVCFYFIGFALMFGPSVGGWYGWDTGMIAWNQREDWDYTFFVFQAVFVGTSATILSGAVAERMKFSAYIIMAVVLSSFIYPIFGHWAWGNLLMDNSSYLMDNGFIDFAGSTVVHSIGGWVALAGVMVIGPRIGRFNPDGSPIAIHGHSYALATLGAIVLWVGWIGFNGGSTTAGTPAFAHIVSNTMIAGAFGGVVSMILGRFHDGLFRPDRSINGVLGGLVGITAGCDAVSTHGALIIGLTSGIVVFYAAWLMENKLRMDDAVGAVPVHGFCGAWGTIMVGFLAVEGSLGAETRWDQIVIQTQGVLLGFIWAFPIAYVIFRLLHMTIGIRVSPEHEQEGLNTAEHGTTLGTGLLQERLKEIVFGDGDLTRRLDSTTGDESAEVAFLFNEFMNKIQGFIISIRANTSKMQDAAQQLTEVATAMASSSEELTAQSEVVADATQRVSGSMGSSSGVLSGVSGEISAISENANQMAGNLEGMSQAVEVLTASIGDIVSRVDESSTISNKASDMSRQAEAAVRTLKEASGRIGSLLTIIRDIADKTNLLALNATIEAARAGEAGKGFAVVANEVKALAGQTAKATEDIEEHIRMIQGNSSDVENVISGTISIIGNMTNSIQEISDLTMRQKENALNIDEWVRESLSKSSDIAQSVAGMSDSSMKIANEVEQVASEAQTMSENVRSFAEEAKDAAHNALAVEQNAVALSKISSELETSISQFKT